jgi:hypothetical protein
MVVSLVAHKNWKTKQLDVRLGLLNGDLAKNVFMLQPTSFEVHGK